MGVATMKMGIGGNNQPPLIKVIFILSFSKKSSHGGDRPGVAPSGVVGRSFCLQQNDRLLPWLAGFFRFQYNYSKNSFILAPNL